MLLGRGVQNGCKGISGVNNGNLIVRL
jgi:hypothetical protein